MAKINAWTGIWAKEVLLCLIEKPKTQKQICEETGYDQGNVSKVLKIFKESGVINNLKGKKQGNSRKGSETWEVNFDAISKALLERMYYPSNPFFGRANRIWKSFPHLLEIYPKYLKIIAKNPLWRSTRWIQKQRAYRKNKWYFKDGISGKKIPAVRDWQGYKTKSTNYDDLTLMSIAQHFLEYLAQNMREPIKWQEWMEWEKEAWNLILGYHLSLDSVYYYDSTIRGERNG